MLALRIIDPFVYDSGTYTCVVKSSYGSCTTNGTLEIVELGQTKTIEDDKMPIFAKHPVPVVALHGSVVSFCAKVWPVYTQVKWSICGREMNESTRGILVSNTYIHMTFFFLE